MKKNHMRSVYRHPAAAPVYFLEKLILGLQSLLVGVGLSFTVLLLLVL